LLSPSVGSVFPPPSSIFSLQSTTQFKRNQSSDRMSIITSLTNRQKHLHARLLEQCLVLCCSSARASTETVLDHALCLASFADCWHMLLALQRVEKSCLMYGPGHNVGWSPRRHVSSSASVPAGSSERPEHFCIVCLEGHMSLKCHASDGFSQPNLSSKRLLIGRLKLG
jgi:hypothetical protein